MHALLITKNSTVFRLLDWVLFARRNSGYATCEHYADLYYLRVSVSTYGKSQSERLCRGPYDGQQLYAMHKFYAYKCT